MIIKFNNEELKEIKKNIKNDVMTSIMRELGHSEFMKRAEQVLSFILEKKISDMSDYKLDNMINNIVRSRLDHLVKFNNAIPEAIAKTFLETYNLERLEQKAIAEIKNKIMNY